MCSDRFHTLLAAEQEHPEAASMHGLVVFTYYAQHPSLCKPWLKELHRRWMYEIFVDGKHWREVISWPKERRRRQAAVDRAKQDPESLPPLPAAGQPMYGEMTVADLGTPGSPNFPASYPENVEAWARSVAGHSFL